MIAKSNMRVLNDVIVKLCELANVKYDLHHQHTTLDAPQTVY